MTIKPLSLLFTRFHLPAVCLKYMARRASTAFPRGAWERGQVSLRTVMGVAITLPILLSCTVGPDYQRPTANVPAEFKELKGWKIAQPKDQQLTGNWWELFKDAELNRLEAQVNISNQSLAQAEAQFRQSQSLVQEATAAYFPTATGTATANRFRAASGQSVAVQGVKNLFGMAMSMAWEPDLWGGVRRQVEANEANAQASHATLQALKLSTHALLAQNYFQLRGLDAEKKLLDDTSVAYQKILTINQNRYAAGVIGKPDITQAQTQLASTQAQAVDVQIARAKLEHAIAMLIGKAPAELTITNAGLTASVPVIPVTIPSELLERRPDIAVAERQVAAANAQIGVAKAAYFPTISLSATKGTQSRELSSLLSTAARYWALGPAAMAVPLFNGGLTGAQMDAAINGFDASVAAYRQSVLVSFQEVEDQLSTLRLLAEEIQRQQQAVTAARESVALIDNQYKAGTVNYLNVMVAQGVALNNEKTAVDLQSQQLQAAVLLVKALGGGWHNSDIPKAGDIGGEQKWSQFLPIPLK
jgi:NodT family efflux transporter outer membrane factor (OMF) lipoprotein